MRYNVRVSFTYWKKTSRVLENERGIYETNLTHNIRSMVFRKLPTKHGFM